MNNPPDKNQIKELIVKKIGQVKEQIRELEDLTKPVAPDVAIGRISRMDAINNKSVNEAALRQAREKLHGLQHALDNIDNPSFGVCSRCGEKIPMGRILVMPESPRCMRCS
ncbi:MAG: TraR/DksA family transcriptional regulator [Bacteroidales bacterium]